MEWFEIYWRGPYTLDSAISKKASESYGVYAIFEKSRSFEKLGFILGRHLAAFGKRLKT